MAATEQENTLQKVKGAQMANLHFGVEAAGGRMLARRLLMQFNEKRDNLINHETK